MSEKMNPADRELMIAATLTSGLTDVGTEAEQAVELLQEVLFRIACRGGITKMRSDARLQARKRATHQG